MWLRKLQLRDVEVKVIQPSDGRVRIRTQGPTLLKVPQRCGHGYKVPEPEPDRKSWIFYLVTAVLQKKAGRQATPVLWSALGEGGCGVRRSFSDSVIDR